MAQRKLTLKEMAAQAQREAYEAQVAATYHDRLMAALEEATNSAFEYGLYVSRGDFLLLEHNSANEYEMSPKYNVESNEVLEMLELDLQHRRTERAEAERKNALRQTALAKLSKEEREALGL